MKHENMWKVGLVFLVVLQLIKAEEIVVGKIVAVDNPNVKRNLKNKNRNQIFATRAVSFLKKDGDLFKIHRPGLLGKEKTVSFESMKIPGFYLRQKNNRVHLDNLKSKFIRKDATFLESKDPVGETFRLFMDNGRFLCHDPGQGFNVLLQKDSPKRDTLNCAFNIVPSKKTQGNPKAGVKEPEVKGAPVNVASKANNTGTGSQGTAGNPGAQGKGAIKNAAVKANQKAGLVAGKAKAQQKADVPNVPIQSLKDLVKDLKGNKDPFQKKKTDSLLIVGGKAKDKIAINNNNRASAVGAGKNGPPKAKFAPGKPKAQPKQVAKQGVKGVLGKPQVQKPAANNNAKLWKAKPVAQKAALPAYKNSQSASPFNFPANQRMKFQNQIRPWPQRFSGQMFKPVNELENNFFKSPGNNWLLGNPTKKVLISNPRWQAKQPLLQPKFSRYNNPYVRNLALNSLLAARYAQQHAVPGRVFGPGVQPTTSQFATSGLNQPQLQYVPPQQWNQVTSYQQSQIKAGITPLQTQHAFSQEVHSVIGPPPVHADANLVSTDNLLSNLHPELSLDHTAKHDVNELSTDAHLQRQDLPVEQSLPLASITHQTALPVSGIVSEAVSTPQAVPMTVASSLPEPSIGSLPHVLQTSGPTHSVELPSSGPVYGSSLNAEAATSLVHTHPDVTLQEAFDKMNSYPLHPIEITSEPIHTFEAPSVPTDKAVHMRTHYVSATPLDMNSDDEASAMKEVHVVHHNHHMIHAADEGEKEKFVSTLMDVNNDLCIAMTFINQLGNRYRLVSTLNPHGYRPKGVRFSLKTIFKVPKKRKIMSFKAYDEGDPHRVVLLNGHKELNVYPVACSLKPVEVVVDSASPSNNVAAGRKRNGVNAADLAAPRIAPHPAALRCPLSCGNECGSECPMSCCSDASSSLLH